MSVRFRQKANTDWLRFSFIFWYNVAVKVKLFSKKNYFKLQVQEIWLAMLFPKFVDSVLWWPTDHMLLLWFLCSRYGKYKKKKRSMWSHCHWYRSCLKITKKWNFLEFSYWNMHWCPNEHIVESKHSENPPLVLTNLIQVIMWHIRHQEI